MRLVAIDGGLIWLDFHVHKGQQVRAKYIAFDDDFVDIEEEDYNKIFHYALPFGQNIPPRGIYIFHLKEEIYGISYYRHLDLETAENINMVAVVWLATRIFNPYILVPALKTIFKLGTTDIIPINEETLEKVVGSVVEHDGMVNCSINGNEVISELPPGNLDNYPVKFLL